MHVTASKSTVGEHGEVKVVGHVIGKIWKIYVPSARICVAGHGSSTFGRRRHIFDLPLFKYILVAQNIQLCHLCMGHSGLGLSSGSALLSGFVQIIVHWSGARCLECFGFGIGSLVP